MLEMVQERRIGKGERIDREEEERKRKVRIGLREERELVRFCGRKPPTL